MLNPGGTSSVRDLLNNNVTNLGASDVSFSGSSLFAMIGAGLLPSTGLQSTAYTANLWPRVRLGNNNQIADFAPDNSNVAVGTVTEPTPLALLMPATAGLLVFVRRRHARR